MKVYDPIKLVPLVRQMIQDGKLSKILYTYMPVEKIEERVIPILQECKLWFSSPIYFNDPFDCKIYPHIPNSEELAFYLANNAENATHKDYENIREGIEIAGKSVAKQAIDRVFNKSGVKCFTQNNTNILMWSHYTNSHKGICLEFDVSNDPAFFVYPIRVVYSERYPQLEFTDKSFTKEVLRTKAKVWEYEQEVRICKPNYGYHYFNPKALKSIIFGCNISSENKNIIMETVRRNHSLDHLAFFACKPNSSQFKLDILPL